MEFRKIFCILLLLFGLCLLLLIRYDGSKREPQFGINEDYLAQSKHPASHSAGGNGFVTGRWGNPEGLGNQIYRFASLYGIGQRLNRRPYFDSGNAQQMSMLPELLTTFPRLFNSLYVLSPNRSDFVSLPFSTQGCCYYDGDYAKSKNVSAQFLQLEANWFQSYKYFDAYRASVLSSLAFGPQVVAAAKQLADSIG
ncbi:Protein C06E1.7, partial [Aphelenchoides avenae]